MNVGAHMPVWVPAFRSSEVESLDHMISLCWIFEEPCSWFPQQAHRLPPTTLHQRRHALTVTCFLGLVLFLFLFYNSRPGSEVVSLWFFICISLMIRDADHLFRGLTYIFKVSNWPNSSFRFFHNNLWKNPKELWPAEYHSGCCVEILNCEVRWRPIRGASQVILGKEPACQCRRWKRHRFNPWVWKIPWRREWQPTPIF